MTAIFFSGLIYLEACISVSAFRNKEDNEKTDARTSLRALCKVEATSKMGECSQWKDLILVTVMKWW